MTPAVDTSDGRAPRSGSGDPDASCEYADFDGFFARHHRDLARLAFLVTGERTEADDIAADALVAAWRQWHRVCSTDQPVAYVRRMVINIAATRVRGRVRERRRLLALIPGGSQHAAVADSDAVIDVRTALLALPPGRRACVVLRYAFDLSEDDVANTLGISVGTVKSQTSKAAAQLRAALGELSGALRPDALPSPGRGRVS